MTATIDTPLENFLTTYCLGAVPIHQESPTLYPPDFELENDIFCDTVRLTFIEQAPTLLYMMELLRHYYSAIGWENNFPSRLLNQKIRGSILIDSGFEYIYI